MPSRCVCTSQGHDGGRERWQQRQRKQKTRPHLVSPDQALEPPPPPPPPPLQSQDKGQQKALLRESGASPRAVLISMVAAVALESPGQVHHQPVVASAPVLVSRWLGGQVSHLTYRTLSTEPGMCPQWVLVQTRLGRTHVPASCFKGPSLEELCSAQTQEPNGDKKVKPRKGDSHSYSGMGFTSGSSAMEEPTPKLVQSPFLFQRSGLRTKQEGGPNRNP